MRVAGYGKIVKVHLELNQSAGKRVQFILGVSKKNFSGGLQVEWFSPCRQD